MQGNGVDLNIISWRGGGGRGGGAKFNFCFVRGGEVRLNFETYFTHFPTPQSP